MKHMTNEERLDHNNAVDEAAELAALRERVTALDMALRALAYAAQGTMPDHYDDCPLFERDYDPQEVDECTCRQDERENALYAALDAARALLATAPTTPEDEQARRVRQSTCRHPYWERHYRERDWGWRVCTSCGLTITIGTPPTPGVLS